MDTRRILIIVAVIALIAFFFPKECMTSDRPHVINLRNEGDTTVVKSQDCTCIGFKTQGDFLYRILIGPFGASSDKVCIGAPIKKTCYEVTHTMTAEIHSTHRVPIVNTDEKEIPC